MPAPSIIPLARLFTILSGGILALIPFLKKRKMNASEAPRVYKQALRNYSAQWKTDNPDGDLRTHLTDVHEDAVSSHDEIEKEDESSDSEPKEDGGKTPSGPGAESAEDEGPKKKLRPEEKLKLILEKKGWTLEPDKDRVCLKNGEGRNLRCWEEKPKPEEVLKFIAALRARGRAVFPGSGGGEEEDISARVEALLRRTAVSYSTERIAKTISLARTPERDILEAVKEEGRSIQLALGSAGSYLAMAVAKHMNPELRESSVGDDSERQASKAKALSLALKKVVKMGKTAGRLFNYVQKNWKFIKDAMLTMSKVTGTAAAVLMVRKLVKIFETAMSTNKDMDIRFMGRSGWTLGIATKGDSEGARREVKQKPKPDPGKERRKYRRENIKQVLKTRRMKIVKAPGKSKGDASRSCLQNQNGHNLKCWDSEPSESDLHTFLGHGGDKKAAEVIERIAEQHPDLVTAASSEIPSPADVKRKLQETGEVFIPLSKPLAMFLISALAKAGSSRNSFVDDKKKKKEVGTIRKLMNAAKGGVDIFRSVRDNWDFLKDFADTAQELRTNVMMRKAFRRMMGVFEGSLDRGDAMELSVNKHGWGITMRTSGKGGY